MCVYFQVVFIRLATSGYLQEKQEFYANFVEGERTVKEYCNQVRLTDALNVLWIKYSCC